MVSCSKQREGGMSKGMWSKKFLCQTKHCSNIPMDRPLIAHSSDTENLERCSVTYNDAVYQGFGYSLRFLT